MNRTAEPASRLQGDVLAPPDKSISHRAALFASLADGVSILEGYSLAADPQSTLDCLRRVGVEVQAPPETLDGRENGVLGGSVESGSPAGSGGGTRVVIRGIGRSGWLEAAARGVERPPVELDCGNSGTTMRLLAGLAGGAGLHARLIGDESLSRRPMDRILKPLEGLGVVSSAREGRYAPIHLSGRAAGQALRGGACDLAIASAQLKSALLLAGLFSSEGVGVREPAASRDHTERMLRLGPPDSQGYLRSDLLTPVPLQSMRIPGDVSAAAFWLVAGAIHHSADLRVKGCGLNPTRDGVVRVLERMGADLEVSGSSDESAEPLGDIRIRSGRVLRPVHVRGELIANVIDELPVLMVAMCFADGRSEISDASELRVKETDRIGAMVRVLEAAGASVEEKPDGVVIEGNPAFEPRGCRVQSEHDHRIAMSAAVLGLAARDAIEVEGADCTAISYPAFWEDLRRLSAG